MSNSTDLATELPPIPHSPGVGARRKGLKSLPKLPLSAFSPPNSGVSESFPLPASPSTVHPDRVVDASVAALGEWQKEVARSKTLEGRATGVVLRLAEGELNGLEATGVNVLSVQIPFKLEDTALPAVPRSQYPVSLAAAFTQPSEAAIAGLSAALKAGHIVDIDVQVDVSSGDNVWDGLEELLTKATTADTEGAGTIILSNILPPPHDLELPIVKLLSHPTYHSYQARIASLSLCGNVFVKFLPPAWNAPTPPTPQHGDETAAVSREKKEWKRRIKMYLGPAVEAFGFQRVLFGSAPSPTSHASSTVGDWYEIARESFAELGVEQADVDAVFGGNAERVYNPARKS